MTRNREKRARAGLARLVAATVLLLVAGLALFYATLEYLRVDEVELPDVTGRTYQEAAAALRSLQLEPVAYPDNVPGARPDTVTNQTPSAGSLVRQGRNVSLGVHRPPEGSPAPVLVGLTLDQAVNTAQAVNLPVGSVEYAYSEQPQGRVIEQRPQPGVQLGSAESLTIVVSRGPEQARATVPEVTGLPIDEARRHLEEAGFRSVQERALGITYDAPGTVRTQEPAAGSEVSRGTPIVLGYQLPARDIVAVPELTGRNAELAGRLLRAAGLQVGEIVYQDDPDSPSGVVLEASPDSFTLRGAPVALTVNASQGEFDDLREQFALTPDPLADASGPGLELDPGASDDPETVGEDPALEGEGRRISITFDPASLGVRSLLERDYDLRLVVQDEAGERTAIDRRVAAGESVSAVVVVYGDAMLQTYINDIFFQAWRP